MNKITRKIKINTLVEARNIISEPGKWTQKFFARDSEGHGCNVASKNAVCWCAMGALKKACSRITEYGSYQHYHLSDDLADYIMESIDLESSSIYNYNDNDLTTHAGILDAFDTAIRRMNYD